MGLIQFVGEEFDGAPPQSAGGVDGAVHRLGGLGKRKILAMHQNDDATVVGTAGADGLFQRLGFFSPATACQLGGGVVAATATASPSRRRVDSRGRSQAIFRLAVRR